MFSRRSPRSRTGPRADPIRLAGRDPVRRGSVGPAGTARGPDPRSWLRIALQFLGQPQQRVRGAVHDVFRDVEYASATAPRRAPEQVERVTAAEPVALGEYPDRLLDPDPGGERVLELGDGHRQPRRLVRLADRAGVP